MSFKPIDPKRDEIRRYLERGSVLDSLTKIFIRVIKERPENPMEYIRNHIGVVRHQHDKYERLQQDLQLANEEIQRLRGIINSINPEVLQGHPGPVIPSEAAPEASEQEVAEQSQDVEPTQQQNGESTPETPSASVVAEVNSAVEACQIEEKVVASNEDVPAPVQPSPSVQVEASSSNE
ncbi:c-Myc-binding protein homolog [Drosophila ficusphila]|uniref:c-Myc-binding protein homolog n=1 Tax=Drosophila ficusphila TaxID=30025 RepID=UPI0007E84C4E|nr:c-Myc-binding protein homolog [Drosophila ficusphila]